MRDKARDLYDAYKADEARVMADPELPANEKGQAITALTNELLEAERAVGVRWKPLFSLEVEATGDGSMTFNLPKEAA